MNTSMISMGKITMGSSRYLTAGFRLAVAAVLFGLASTSFATVINVDFNSPGGASGTYIGTAVAPDSGTTWNGISAAGTFALVDSAGGATPVTFHLDYAAFYDATENPSLFAPALMNDYLYQDPVHGSGNTPFSFNGLVGSSYDLYVYSQNAGYSSSTTITEIGGTPPQKWAINAASMSSFVEDQNYVKFLGLVPTSGTISGWVYGVGGLSINGMQLVELVPEPSSLGLIGLGLLVMWNRNRKAKQ